MANSSIGSKKIKGMYFNGKIKEAYFGKLKVFSADEPYYDTVSVPSRSSWKVGYTNPTGLMEWGSLSDKVYAKYDGTVSVTIYITGRISAGTAVDGTGWSDAEIYKNGSSVWRNDPFAVLYNLADGTKVTKTMSFRCKKGDYFQLRSGAVSAGGSAQITTETGVDFNFKPE